MTTMLLPNPNRGPGATFLALPTEIRCLIYTKLLPPPTILPQLYLLQTERHSITASFPARTASYHRSTFTWYFYQILDHIPEPSTFSHNTNAHTTPNRHTTTVASDGHRESAYNLIHWLKQTMQSGSERECDQQLLFAHLFKHLLGFPPVAGAPVRLRYEQPVKLQDRPNMYWFDRYKDKRIEVLTEPRAMMEVCSKIRAEFRDWLFSRYEIYLEHGMYKGYALPPSVQAARVCPEVCKLVMVLNIGDDVEVMAGQLLKLKGLTSLTLQVTCDHEVLRPHVEIRTEKEIREYQAAATGVLVRVAFRLERLVEFRMFSVRKGLMKWFRGEEVEKAVLRTIEGRRKK